MFNNMQKKNTTTRRGEMKVSAFSRGKQYIEKLESTGHLATEQSVDQ